jgi:hypothetical protein
MTRRRRGRGRRGRSRAKYAGGLYGRWTVAAVDRVVTDNDLNPTSATMHALYICLCLHDGVSFDMMSML